MGVFLCTVEEAHRILKVPGQEGQVHVMSVTIEYTSNDELRQRRARVLASVELTYAELAELAAAYALTPEELAAWDEIQAISFLLGDE